MSHVCERLTSPKYAFKVKVPSLYLSFFKKKKKNFQDLDFFAFFCAKIVENGIKKEIEEL